MPPPPNTQTYTAPVTSPAKLNANSCVALPARLSPAPPGAALPLLLCTGNTEIAAAVRRHNGPLTRLWLLSVHCAVMQSPKKQAEGAPPSNAWCSRNRGVLARAGDVGSSQHACTARGICLSVREFNVARSRGVAIGCGHVVPSDHNAVPGSLLSRAITAAGPLSWLESRVKSISFQRVCMFIIRPGQCTLQLESTTAAACRSSGWVFDLGSSTTAPQQRWCVDSIALARRKQQGTLSRDASSLAFLNGRWGVAQL
jgi:hypothetical protein